MKHGGNIYRAAEGLGMSEGEIIDFSASINPLGVPETVAEEIRKNIGQLYNYPDPEAKLLTDRLARHLEINPNSIICGNGSTELIYLTVQALKPQKVIIPMPTFSEYERAVGYFGSPSRNESKIGCISGRIPEIQKNPDDFIQAMQGCDLAFICNPNNPTGKLVGRADMLKIAQAACEYGCYLVVDEAFIDFLPGMSLAAEVEHNPYLIVLRSMTKFYALSGLRLGYGIYPSHLVEIMRQHKQPWTVNTMAQRAGIAALGDLAYAKETFRMIAREKQFMEDNFSRLGIEYIPSAVNYYLIRLDRATTIIDKLLGKGILVRDCRSFGLDESYVRVAVKSRKHNEIVFKELSE